MKAALALQYGPPEVLTLTEVTTPKPKPSEVLIRIEAAAVNSADWRLRRAQPHLVRLFFGLTKPKHPILGGVVAGTIVEVGQKVSRFTVGDNIYGSLGIKMGGYAEFVCLSEDEVIVKRPDILSATEAASIPFGAMTAWHFLQKAQLEPKQSLLIYGASGAVGTAAVQMARYLGADITAVCSTANVEWVRALGADRVIDYTQNDMATLSDRFDVIFETVNKADLKILSSKLLPKGRLIIGAGGIKELLLAPFLGRKGKKVIAGIAQETVSYMEIISCLVEAGHLRPVIDKVYPLDEIVAAHTYVEQGHKKGNVVVTISE